MITKHLIVAYYDANKDGWSLAREKEQIQRGFGSVTHVCTHTCILFCDPFQKQDLKMDNLQACLGILGLPWVLEHQEPLASLGFLCHLSAHQAQGALEAPLVQGALMGDTKVTH